MASTTISSITPITTTSSVAPVATITITVITTPELTEELRKFHDSLPPETLMYYNCITSHEGKVNYLKSLNAHVKKVISYRVQCIDIIIILYTKKRFNISSFNYCYRVID